ncbi:MAG: glycosyl transferase [Gammaproteobacteria bacterium]|nr:MAG: glycosyl transferase [Gammaproteobacteria bacterium]
MHAPRLKISIVIPVLNEENHLSIILGSLQKYRDSGHQVIVADGGSSDNSVKLASVGADDVVVSLAGRAMQMNSSAAIATGDVLLFLHCDTVLPHDAIELITKQCLSSKSTNIDFWGRFDVRLSSRRKIYRVIEKLMNLRSRYTAVATGDQAIFIERDLFKRIGGFPEIALMEDVAISKILKQLAEPFCINKKVITSSRRWETHGVIKTVLLMWKLRLLYLFGVSPDKLARLYRR